MSMKAVAEQTAAPIPVEYAGKWIAWSADHLQIVARGESLEELWRIVQDRRVADPIFEKVPRHDVRFVGMR